MGETPPKGEKVQTFPGATRGAQRCANPGEGPEKCLDKENVVAYMGRVFWAGITQW